MRQMQGLTRHRLLYIVSPQGVLLTFHFRNVPAELREPLVVRARQLITQAGFDIGNAHCALECRYQQIPDWDKVRKRSTIEFKTCIGPCRSFAAILAVSNY